MSNLRSYLVVAALAVASPALADPAPPRRPTSQVDLAARYADAITSEIPVVWFHNLIEFSPASTRVYSSDRELLWRMARTWIQGGQHTLITVHGYSDSLDLGLAERRATRIRGYLIKAGVSPSHVTILGHTLDKQGRRIDLSIVRCGRDECGSLHASTLAPE